jgi:DNA-binding transcriptional regulator YiaG
MPAKPADDFPSRFKAAREARGMTQQEAADDLGMHRVTVAVWEAGTKQPSGLARRAVETWIAASRRRKPR